VNFRIARLFVNPLLAPSGSGPFEMFHDVRQINTGVIDPGLLQCPIEKLSRRAHKRMSRTIFLVSGLLPDKHDL
jgi:hypothetical protein